MTQIDQKSLKSEVWGVPEALGRGLGVILVPKSAQGTKSMRKGNIGFPPRGTLWRPKLRLFRLKTHLKIRHVLNEF